MKLSKSALLLSLGLTQVLSAQTAVTWNGSASGVWSDSTNWNSGLVPAGNNIINIAGSSNLSASNDLAGGALNQYRLFFNTGAGAFTLGGNAVSFFDFGGAAPKIENNSTSTQTIDFNLTLDGAGTGGSAEINPVDGNLTFGGTVSLADTTVLNVWGSNQKTLTFNQGISAATFGQLVLNQQNTVVLNGTSNFGGNNDLTNSNGNITVGANPTGSGPSLTVNGTLTGVDNFSLQKGTLNLSTGSVLNVVRFVSSDSSGGISTINQTGGNFTVSGSVAPSTTSGSFLLGHWGASSATTTYNLSGGSLNVLNADTGLSWDGATTMNVSGTGVANLRGIAFASSTRTTPATLNLQTGGRLNLGAGGAYASVATNKTLNLSGGTLGAFANYTVSTLGVVLSGTSTINTLDSVDNTSGRTVTVSSVVSGSGNIVKSGDGTLVFSGANTYSGTTSVTGGKLTVSNTLRNSSSFGVTGSTSTLELGTVNMFVSGHGVAVDAARVLTISSGGTLLMNASMDSRIGNVTFSNGGTWTSNRALSGYDVLLTDVTGGAATVSVTGTGLAAMNGSGGIHLQGIQNFSVADTVAGSGTDLAVSMVLGSQGLAGGAAGGIIKSGAGTMTLSAINTYTGGTTVNAGVLNLATGGSSGAIRGTATVNTGAVLRASAGDATGYATDASRLSVINLVGGEFNIATTSNQTLGSAVVNMTGGTMTGVANSNLDFFAGSSALNSLASSTTSTVSGLKLSIRQTGGLTITTAAGTTPSGVDLNISSVIASNGSFTTQPLIKAGAGTLQLSGANTFSGGLTVNEGTVLVDGNQSSNRLLANSSVTVNSGGAFAIRGVNALPNGGSSVDFTVNSGGTLSIVSGGSTDIGSGGTSHAHVRNLNLNGGTVSLSYSGAGAAYHGESFQLNGNVTVAGSSPSLIQSSGGTAVTGLALSGSRTFTVGDVTGDSAVDLTVSAEIENNDSSSGVLVKEGLGTLLLSGANSYSGGTTVNAGTARAGHATAFGSGVITLSTGATLDLNGYNLSNSITNNGGTLLGASGSATISQSGGTLSGSVGGTITATGTVAGSPTITGTLKGSGTTFTGAVTFANGSTHAPGNSPGLQTLSSATYNTGSTLEIEFVGNTLAIRGTDFDAVDITGAGGLTIQSGAFLKLIDLGAAIDYSAADWNSVRNFTIVDSTGGGTTSGDFTLDTSLAGSFGTEGSWSVLTAQGLNGATVLTWTPVPEPSTCAALAGLSVLALAWKRRRSRVPGCAA